MGRPLENPHIRFWTKVNVNHPSGCWIWYGAVGKNTYGNFTIKRKNILAHRYAYEYFNGKIPKGMTIDHLCKERICCNPKHMEVVTMSENTKRAKPWLIGAPNSAKKRSAKKHCKNGHLYTKENTATDGEGYRRCRDCARNA